jgi:Sodium:dicarboxylate symporter family/Major Facilitator Superfamily
MILRMLGAIAPPLILLAVMRALIGANARGRMAGKMFFLLALNTVVAIGIGLLIANLVRPGRHASLPPGEPPKLGGDVLAQLLDNIPTSLARPLVENNVIGVIPIAVALGLATRRLDLSRKRRVLGALDIGFDLILVVLKWIIAAVPLAVFCKVTYVVGTQGFAPFAALGWFIVAVLIALALQATYYLVRVWLGSWVSPWRLLSGTRDALAMAFSTASSTVTMPVTLRDPAREDRAARGVREPGRAGREYLQQRRHRALRGDGGALHRADDRHRSRAAAAGPRGAHQRARFGRRGGNPRSRPRDDDAGLLGRSSAHGLHRAPAAHRLVPGSLPHDDQRDGRHERQLHTGWEAARAPRSERARCSAERDRLSRTHSCAAAQAHTVGWTPRTPFRYQRPPMADAPTQARHLVVAWTLAVAAIAYLDRVCISTAAPAIRAELGLSDGEMGLVFSAFTLAYALFEVPSGWFADRFGARGRRRCSVSRRSTSSPPSCGWVSTQASGSSSSGPPRRHPEARTRRILVTRLPEPAKGRLHVREQSVCRVRRLRQHQARELRTTGVCS